MYAEVNLDSLRHGNGARSWGEFVETFASMLGATDATRPAVLKLFQNEYASLFPFSPDELDTDMLNTLSAKLAQHKDLIG